MSDFNDKIIEEFRANSGKVGEPFAGAPLLLLHTRGAKSGKERVTPVVFQADGDRWVIFASFGGAPVNPAWYHNLLAEPNASIETGTEQVPVRARVAAGEEHDALWARQKEIMPGFAAYEAKTTRTIPVVVLERAA